jgi:hypothetical protein
MMFKGSGDDVEGVSNSSCDKRTPALIVQVEASDGGGGWWVVRPCSRDGSSLAPSSSSRKQIIWSTKS